MRFLLIQFEVFDNCVGLAIDVSRDREISNRTTARRSKEHRKTANFFPTTKPLSASFHLFKSMLASTSPVAADSLYDVPCTGSDPFPSATINTGLSAPNSNFKDESG